MQKTKKCIMLLALGLGLFTAGAMYMPATS